MRKILAVIFSVFLLTAHAYAGGGHDHNHEPSVEPAPHGGMLRDALPYKVELVINNEHLCLQ